MESVDLAVIGAGPGGYVAAIRGAQLGLKVALIEQRASLGGTCLNVGCIPSKALLKSSELYHKAVKGFETHGISLGPVELDLHQLMSRKARVVEELTEGIALLIKKNKIPVLHGHGILAGEGRIVVASEDETRELRAEHIVLATGSTPLEVPSLPFDGIHIVSSTEAISFDRVPDHLVVVGAGAVGLELGSVWNRLGAQVTVVEMLAQITPFADTMIAKTLQRALADQGMAFRLNSRVMAASVDKGSIMVTLEDKKKGQESLTCDKMLVSVGRKPCTAGLGLEETGVVFDDSGRIEVDENFRTNVPGLYAIGDLIRGPMLAHKAQEEGVAVADTIAGRPGHINYQAIPSVVYTSPELAQVGIGEQEAKVQGLSYKVGRCYFKANGRARCMGEEAGLVKVISEEGNDRLLGVHIIGPNASEMIAEAVMVFELQGTAEDLARAVHAHPTLSENIKEAALATNQRAIHG